ncbi:hypothetical protein BDDG_05688 [Blastomyces dermatitidis ATCC 18188]|uniref:Uncharacterized protein n=1 Tax=Ajellomyces dermatitidis (strain ATCC 18188 / CBS 674.68) TaxID=653446 RepID=F2THN1_AJEDA|nr:hypothetical protein BDDG_05688 [Blastomyces dermatitidis ATCC 18188]
MPKPPLFGRRRRSTPTPSRIDESSVLDTEITEVSRDRKRETAVTFNVFYGKPDLSRQLLKHVAFTDNASVHTEFFEQCGRQVLVQNGKDKGKGQGKKGKEKGKEKMKNAFYACQTVESGLPQFQELAYLAAGFSEEVLKLCVGGCAACGSHDEDGDGDGDGGKGKGKASAASAMVYRPLCCSVDGYEMLEDGLWMRKLMMAIAHLVEEFDTCEKAKKAIGIVEKVEGMDDEAETHPFVNILAVPVCEPDGECQNIAEKAIDSFMQGILKGLESDNKRSSARFSSRGSFSKGAFDESVWEDDMGLSDGDTEKDDDDVDSEGDTENDQAPPKKRDRPSLSRHMSLETMQPVRLVVFSGIPIVDPKEPPRHGRLNMLLFTSNWPTEMLTGYGDREEPEYVCYQHIAAFHEQAMLDATDFRCAICPGTGTKATALFHSPISFKRDNSNSSSSLQPIRDIIMKLAKYVGGSWKYPDTTAALGLDGFPNITDFVVPICERDSVCEKTALVTAQVFLHMYLPEGVIPLYPDLYPTTDFARIWKKEKFGKNPRLISKMIGTGLMSDSHDGGQEEHRYNGADTDTKTPQRPSLKGRHSNNRSSTGSEPRTRSWIKGMTIEDFRQAVENGATWDQLKELCFENLRIVLDFQPPVTPMALATAPTSPVAATPTSETFQGGVLEGGGLTSSFGSSFGYPSSATTSWSSAGLAARGDEGYFTVKKV